MNGNILIDKANLIHNLSEIKRHTPNSKIMSVIKSNGMDMECWKFLRS